MIFKCFPNLTCNASTWTETILELAINEPDGYNNNKQMYYQPATVELYVSGSNGIYIEFTTSIEDDDSKLQGGMLLDAGQRYVLDFNLGLYKVKIKSATGSSTLRINGMYYIRVDRTK
jgi:hypothetical protein